MRREYKYVITFIWFFLLFLGASAQDLDSVSSIITHDTLYQNNVSPQENYQFKEVTRPSKIDTRKASPSEVEKLKSDEDYWYVNQVPPRSKNTSRSGPGVNEKGEKEPEAEPVAIFNSPILNLVFWILLIGGFVALLAWFLATSKIRLFRKKTNLTPEEEQEQTTGDIFQMNFEKEINKAIETREYRLAVRLMYLQTLRELSNRSFISYSPEKTNGNYLFQLAGTRFYRDFFKLTRSFDYTWYGQFQLSQDSFATIRNDFLSFKRELA